jgi:hypothetical protein
MDGYLFIELADSILYVAVHMAIAGELRASAK